MNFLNDVTSKIINGYMINKNEALNLLEYSHIELGVKANKIREFFCGNLFDICTIVNGKSGKCSEDCKYCAQSKYYSTGINTYPLLSINKLVDNAEKNYKQGILRYSIVTSGKQIMDEELDILCDAFREIKRKSSIKPCASFGLLKYDQFLKLKKSGVERYHNNLETSEKFFPNICTTHTYQEKVNTIKQAQAAGLEVCSGGIIGLGESNEDRLDLAFTLRELEIKSIPLNILNPIKGTPMEKLFPINEKEFLKIASIFRFINPKACIRLAGGRNLLNEHGKDAFLSGINGTISGELLTTYGNNTKKDMDMINRLGFKVEL